MSSRKPRKLIEIDQIPVPMTTRAKRRSENDSGSESISPEKQSKSNKYRSARKILTGAPPDDLIGREKELSELTDFLTERIEAKSSGSLYVSGQPGTGKTASLTKIIDDPLFKGKFIRIYINCTTIASIGGIYKKICQELGLKVGTEVQCLTEIDAYLTRKRSKHILLVLDEIDQLTGKKQSILYTIFEWPAKPKSKLILIGVANSLDLTDRLLTRLNSRCELKPRLMHFLPYTKQQIVDIFTGRLRDAGVLDIFPPVTIQLLAAKVAAVSGDVRRALDIGRRITELAERGDRKRLTEKSLLDVVDDPKPERIEAKQVMSVLNDVYGASQALEKDLEDSFPLQQKLLICSLLLLLKREKNRDITLGRLHTVYQKICGRRNIQSVDQTEFVGLCALVETRGILRIIKRKEMKLSRVQLQWDEGEVNDGLKDKQLVASILSDQLK